MKHAVPKTDQTERLSWGIVEFQVTDLARAVDFWTQALGIHIRAQDDQEAQLGTTDTTLIILRGGATKPVARAHLGMYHVAIGVPDQVEFSRILARLISKGIGVSPTDHLASKSLYLADPDGLEIEVIFETPERFGSFGDMTKGLTLYDAQGNPHSGRAPLDVEAELTHAKAADLDAPLSDQAFLAHMHFKVPTLDAGTEWFEGIGFSRGLMIPNFGFADMGVGGGFSHRLAMNIWSGPDLSPAPSDMARLTKYTLHAHQPAVIANAQGLGPSAGGLTGVDPTGVQIDIVPVY